MPKTNPGTDSDGEDDEVELYFVGKRKSSAKIVDDDLVVERTKRSRPLTKFEAWLEDWYKIPSLYGDERGEVDTSKAASVVIDGPALKKTCDDEYFRVLDFAYRCRQKGHLKLFHHPGDPRNRIDGLGFSTSKALEGKALELAGLAIKEYQKVNQKVMLKLKDLMKLNASISGGMTYYITFSAEDELTKEIMTYQAALLEYLDGCLLGLLRNLVADEILAILSIKGAEDDLARLAAVREGNGLDDD